MDLFGFCSETLKPGEELIVSLQKGITLYDGDDKYKGRNEVGTSSLTSHRLVWKNGLLTVGLDLSAIVLIDKDLPKKAFGGFISSGTPKIVLHVQRPSLQSGGPSPFACHGGTQVKLGFTDGGLDAFFSSLERTLSEQRWSKPLLPSAGGRYRAGIVGIERQREKEARDTTRNISEAFSDLKTLMESAKPMVALAATISAKVKDAGVSADETVTFRAALLSLGVKDPVTKATCSSGKEYFERLAKEVVTVLSPHVQEAGGMMTLVEAFVRLNRARGVSLVSPEDFVSACAVLESLHLSLRLRTFTETGVKVLASASFDDKAAADLATNLVSTHSSLSPAEAAQAAHIPLLLAKQGLLLAEQRGSLCRDESLEGLRFYCNLFLHPLTP